MNAVRKDLYPNSKYLQVSSHKPNRVSVLHFTCKQVNDTM